MSLLFVILTITASASPQQQAAPPASFQALAPEFWKLFDHANRVEVMGSKFGFTEGPVWNAAGFLFVSDEEKNAIYRLYPDGRRDTVISLGDPDGNTYDQQQRLIDCASVLRAIIRLSSDGKSYKVLADRYQGRRFNSPNDVTLGPDGALYFTDPTLDLVAGQKQEIPFQGVYRLDSLGNVTLLNKDLKQPNGLAFSPDGSFLYVDDSETKQIWRFSFHGAALSNGVIFGSEAVAGSKAVPDGMKIDMRGNLFVVGPGGIWVWNPAGRHIGTVLTPEQPANLAWGGVDHSTLFITAGSSVYQIRSLTRGD